MPNFKTCGHKALNKWDDCGVYVHGLKTPR